MRIPAGSCPYFIITYFCAISQHLFTVPIISVFFILFTVKSNKTQSCFLDISLIFCVLLCFVLISQQNADILKTESKKYVSNAFLICLATNHKLQSVYKKEKMIMSNEMKQKAVKAVPNRWFVFYILTLSGGIAFKLSSMKDMFYVPMQQFMGLTNTQIGGALSAYGIVQTIGLIFGIYICDMFSKKYMIGGSLIGLGAIGVYLSTFPVLLGFSDRVRRNGHSRRGNLLAGSFKSDPPPW